MRNKHQMVRIPFFVFLLFALCFSFTISAENQKMLYLDLSLEGDSISLQQAHVLDGRARSFRKSGHSWHSHEINRLQFQVSDENQTVKLEEEIDDPGVMYLENKNGQGCEVRRQEKVNFVLRIPYSSKYREISFYRIKRFSGLAKAQNVKIHMGSFSLDNGSQ